MNEASMDCDDNNDFKTKWVNLLIRGETKNQERFEKILDDNDGNVIAAIMEFRQQLFQEGRGKGLVEEYAENIGDRELTAEYLSEMFLEPITVEDFIFCRKLIIKNGWSFMKILEKHEQYPTKRFMRILTCKCQ